MLYVLLNRDLRKYVYTHTFSTYISIGMLNCIQGQVPLMSELTAQLHSQNLHHYAIS